MILHLGVNDDVTELSGLTSHAVGTILEDKYGLLSVFYEYDKEKITRHIEEAFAGAIEDMQLGSTATDPIGAIGQQITKDFKDFLNSSVVESLGIPGVPTQAALNGVQSAKKGKRGPRRPSFIDTGIFRDDFKAWID